MNTMIAVGRGVKTPLFYAHNIEQDGRYKVILIYVQKILNKNVQMI